MFHFYFKRKNDRVLAFKMRLTRFGVYVPEFEISASPNSFKI